MTREFHLRCCQKILIRRKRACCCLLTIAFVVIVVVVIATCGFAAYVGFIEDRFIVVEYPFIFVPGSVVIVVSIVVVVFGQSCMNWYLIFALCVACDVSLPYLRFFVDSSDEVGVHRILPN